MVVTTPGRLVGWRLLQDYRLSGGSGAAFRAPTFIDLYYPGASNPHLKPEESDNIELTLEGSAFEAFWHVQLIAT